MFIDRTTFNEIVNLLIPHCTTEISRQTLADEALFNCHVLEQIDYSGTVREYTVRLVKQLLLYGKCESGEPALALLLDELKTYVGIEQHAGIDDYIARITATDNTALDLSALTVQPVDEDAHIFISYSRENLEIVNRLNTALLNAGLNVWFDQVGLKAGNPDWEQALRDAIESSQALIFMASPTARRSPYVRGELAIAKASQKIIYPVWVAGDEWTDCAPINLMYTQFIDVRGGSYETGLPKILDAMAQLDAPAQKDKTDAIPEIETHEVESEIDVDTDQPPRNPYKGLKAFQAEDRGDFFGREDFILELIDTLRDGKEPPRFLAVVGASGSGKSSVVMAGLLPALQSGAIAGSENWLYLEPFVPGENPIENLTTTLRSMLPQMPFDTIVADLNSTTTKGLHRLVQQILADHAKRMVIYIDQFEELFTLTASEDERQQFIDVLTTAVDELDGQVIVICSMRADFYDRPLEYPQLGGMLEDYSKNILPLTLADLYDVVQKPADLPDVQIQFEEGLETELVFAVREQVGGLPLLQFTLEQLFEKRQGQTLTWDAYNEIGGVKGALAKQADKTYAELPSDRHRQLARTLFLRLIEPGATEQDTTRRRATYNQLALTDTEATRILQETANAFVSARLLVTNREGETTTIEVSHEALIREWERLGEWLKDARDDVRLQRALAADVSEWKRRDYPDDMLYRGTVLEDAIAWSKRETPNRDEQLFLNSSVAAQELQRKRDAAIARRVQNFQRAAVGLAVVAVIAFIATIGAGLAFWGSRNQAAEATIAQGQSVIRESTAIAAQDTAIAREGIANEQVETAIIAQETSIAREGVARAQVETAIAAVETANVAQGQSANREETAIAREDEANAQVTQAQEQLGTATVEQGLAIIAVDNASTQVANASTAEYAAREEANVAANASTGCPRNDGSDTRNDGSCRNPTGRKLPFSDGGAWRGIANSK